MRYGRNSGLFLISLTDRPFSVSAPVGQTWTHFPQPVQVSEVPQGWFMSVMTRESIPRPLRSHVWAPSTSSQTLDRTQAYWFEAAVVANFYAPLEISPSNLDGLIYGIRANGHFVCLDPTGKIRWSSGPTAQFGLGPFMMADRLIYAMNDSGLLSLLELSQEKYVALGKAQVLKGRESWGPMALAGGRLIVRDLTRVVCLDVAAK